ncbi:Ubiquitin-conjugating enzyme E2 5 isoform 1 [Hibiscus syriacus]|uniref:Ubiquitin-conjugating enzyme E2 5 isoform 1 n=1 Tax=Hibiscus syriacus TaxID=106335 RepID=A0A6A3C1K1_HIBSY|nr:Ubiquitin-conjugating enzyme E2 5 isoform 1 [Hibiscus syriacus]
MTGWSLRAVDGPSLDCAKYLEKLGPATSFVDLEPFSEALFLKSEPNKLRFWFNKFLGLFLKEICAQGCFWPHPPLLADGRPVDLFKLFLINYLVSLERCLERIAQSEDSKSESNCSDQLMELGAELKWFLLGSKKKIIEYSQVEENIVAGSDGGEKRVKGEESIHIDLMNRVLRYEEVENLQNDHDLKSVVFDSEGDNKFILVDDDEDVPSDMAKSAVNSMCNDDEDCTCSDDDDDVMILDSNDDPCHLVIGSLPDSSKWKAYGSEELWKQVLLFREVAFRRNDNHSSAGQANLQKNQKMHPCTYGDNWKPGYNLRERLSFTRKVFFGKTASKGEARSQTSDSSMIGIDKQLHGIRDSITPGSVFDYDVDIQVPIGPLFQAEVPEWTGVVYESEAKWLGTRVWPLEKMEKRSLIGKGRPDSCGCHLQGSVQCVKFHIREKRLRVKLELGSAFNKWKFDKMGEDVAFAWAEEQQKMFSSIVKSNPPSLEKSFWEDIHKCFPKKSREELVCYHFNVFILRRRAYQNRITPSNINSDEEPGSGISKQLSPTHPS